MAFKLSHFLTAAGLSAAFLTAPAFAAPNCKGPSKNDPGCVEEPPPEEPPLAAVSTVVDSVTVDWPNQKLIVRGVDLDTVAAFTLGGSGALTTGTVAAGEVELLFDAAMATEVSSGGSYALQFDGVDAISIYFVAAVVDPAATGCPCDVDWAAALGGRWGADDTACYSLSSGSDADIAGTVLSDPLDPAAYPQYPIGAAYYADNPAGSVCRLVEVTDVDPFEQDLVNERINASQQADCAALLQTNVCATTEAFPAP